MKYALKSLIRVTICRNTVSSTARFISSRSAPNISGTSVRITPPRNAVSRSAMRPTSGLAVMPLNPSELPQGLEPRVHLVGDVLRIKKPEAALVDVAREREERVHLVVLAAEAEDQDAARVGMAQQAGEGPLGVAEVVAELAASVGVREAVDAVNASLEPRRALARNALCRMVHAADRVEDPHLVARPDAAVGAPISHERRPHPLTPSPFGRGGTLG